MTVPQAIEQLTSNPNPTNEDFMNVIKSVAKEYKEAVALIETQNKLIDDQHKIIQKFRSKLN